MITLLVIFIILILIIALSKNYFIGYVKNDKPLFSDLLGKKALSDNQVNLNKLIVKSDKVINKELCISIDSKLLHNSHDAKLQLKSTNTVNDNYKFKLLNVSSSNEIVIYHPETNSYIYSNDDLLNNDNELVNVNIGQLNILKECNIRKAKFNLVYKSNNLLNITNTDDKLADKGYFTLQHKNSGLYLGVSDTNEEQTKLVLVNKPVNTKLLYYTSMEKIGKVNELINDVVESFGTDKGSDNRNKRGMCLMVKYGLIPSSLVDCNLKDEIESFTTTDNNDNDNDNDTFDFNIFSPHNKIDYQNLFKSYGKNLYEDNLEVVEGDTAIEYLKNYHMSILNKNNELQTFIDKESIQLENILDTKMDDLNLIKLNKDSMAYYSLNK